MVLKRRKREETDCTCHRVIRVRGTPFTRAAGMVINLNNIRKHIARYIEIDTFEWIGVAKGM